MAIKVLFTLPSHFIAENVKHIKSEESRTSQMPDTQCSHVSVHDPSSPLHPALIPTGTLVGFPAESGHQVIHNTFSYAPLDPVCEDPV